jgi:hypothetical protein
LTAKQFDTSLTSAPASRPGDRIIGFSTSY